MAEMSKNFNFDGFDQWIGETLDENDDAMAQVYALSGIKRVLRPGEIGAVIAQPSSFTEPEPPEAA